MFILCAHKCWWIWINVFTTCLQVSRSYPDVSKVYWGGSSLHVYLFNSMQCYFALPRWRHACILKCLTHLNFKSTHDVIQVEQIYVTCCKKYTRYCGISIATLLEKSNIVVWKIPCKFKISWSMDLSLRFFTRMYFSALSIFLL